MLRINQQRSSAGAAKYFDDGLAKGDYYTRDEIPGRWSGLAAERLGLGGEVTREAFIALCDNLHPTTGERLTLRMRDNRTVGYDFTFNVPKSLSVLYTLSQDQRIMDAFRGSVRQTMQELEAEARVRVRKGGQDAERTTGNLVWAEFIHLTSRPVGGIPDPHLHAHCFVMNASFDGVENAWKAAQFRNLMRDAPYFEAAFHARLSRKVSDLGYGVERTAKGWEVAGFTKQMIEKFSRRTQQIEETAKAKGISSAEEKARLGAKTREAKGEGQPLEALRAEWGSRLDATERVRLRDIQNQRIGTSSMPIVTQEAINHSLRHGFERASVVSDKRLLATALRRGLGSLEVDAVKEAFARRTDVLRKQHADQTFCTTKEVLAEEAEIVAFAREGRGTAAPIARKRIRLERFGLNADQQAAVRHVLTSTDQVMLIRGAAGTGKTTLLRAAAEEIQSNNQKVHVFAPTSEAARGVLRRDGFHDAETVAMLLKDQKLQKQLKGQVMVVDEAGLLGAKDLHGLFRVAWEQDARVVLIGDAAQHTPVIRGDTFRLLQQHAGVDVVEVHDIMRQQGEYKKAVESLSRGDLEGGLAQLDGMGKIVEVEEQNRHRHLATDYMQAVREKKSALVIAPTHAEGKQVTSLIRESLKDDGKLAEKERVFEQHTSFGLTEAMRQDPVNYRTGDVVVFHQNVKGGFQKGDRVKVTGHDAEGNVLVSKGKGKAEQLPLREAKHFDLAEAAEVRIAVGERIRITRNGETADGKGKLINGSIHTVRGFNRRGDIRLDNGQVVAKDFAGVAHGYCTTSHASQGKTVDRVFIALGQQSYPAASQEQMYVSVSRGRQDCKIYCTDKQELQEAVQRSSKRMTATKLTQGEKPRLPPTKQELQEEVQRSGKRTTAAELTQAANPNSHPVRARLLKFGNHLRRQLQARFPAGRDNGRGQDKPREQQREQQR